MSITAYATAVRDHLRSNLTNFHGNSTERQRNCKVMLDEKPTPDCGQEFIAIYGSSHQPRSRNLMQGLDEEFGITVAVSRKIAVIPQDYRGELGYSSKPLPSNVSSLDENEFLETWASVEDRCREIVRLIVGGDRYRIMVAANNLITTVNRKPAADVIIGGPFLEPLLWEGTDPAPRQVGPDHFTSFFQPIQDTDPVFGLLMKVYFGGAVRMHPLGNIDQVAVGD